MYVCKIDVKGVISGIPCDMSLEGLYSVIGCELIETVNLGGYIEGAPIMLIDEEGKCKGLEINPVATYLFQRVHGAYDFIVGDVALVLFDGADDFIGFDSSSDAVNYARRLIG